MIVNSNRLKVGIVVDKVIGELPIIIKSLGKYYKMSRIIRVTILGNGSLPWWWIFQESLNVEIEGINMLQNCVKVLVQCGGRGLYWDWNIVIVFSQLNIMADDGEWLFHRNHQRRAQRLVNWRFIVPSDKLIAKVEKFIHVC